jgi:hypothetical protein
VSATGFGWILPRREGARGWSRPLGVGQQGPQGEQPRFDLEVVALDGDEGVHVVDLGFGFASHGDDGFSSGVSFYQIPHGLGDFGERVSPVDDRGDLPGFDELLEDH